MKSKKIFVLMIILLLLISTTANAITFVDISDHWAKDYILKVAENNIVLGFEDGTFRPEEKVTVLQSLIMMSRLYKIDEDIREQIIDKYTPIIKEMSNYSNYTWAIDDLCIAIELGIVSESGLSNMFSGKTISNPATKEQIAILLTKAMMLGDKATSLKTFALPFNDVNDISTVARPYIYVMYNEGIVQGDANKNINPTANITRAIIATMLDRAYSYIVENKIEPNFDDYSQTTTTSINGIITEVSIADVESYIYIKDNNGLSTIIRINNGTSIYLNNKKTTIDKISKDMIVSCEIDDQRLAKVIEADNQTKIIEGIISYVAFSPPATITVVDSKKNELKYNVSDAVKVYLDGEEIQLKNLKQKDIITMLVKDNVVNQIKSISRIKKYEGKITSIDYSNLPLKITVKTKDDKLMTFEYTSEVQVTRNNEKSSFDQVRVGDDVTITTEYDKMIQINTNAAEAELSGTIKEILIAPQSKIKIADVDGKIKEYLVSSNVKINIGTKNSTIYDLRLGYYVDVNTSGDQIVTIEAEEIQTAKGLSGKVVFVNLDDKLIMIQNITDNGQTELIHLKVTNSTKIFNISGNTKYLKDISEGINIISTAISQGGEYIAVSIMIQ